MVTRGLLLREREPTAGEEEGEERAHSIFPPLPLAALLVSTALHPGFFSEDEEVEDDDEWEDKEGKEGKEGG